MFPAIKAFRMNYEEWIKRERRIRTKILNSSPVIQKDRIYRICSDCEEVLLCHEEECPNCKSINVINKKLDFNNSHSLDDRIRCRNRFMDITGG